MKQIQTNRADEANQTNRADEANQTDRADEANQSNRAYEEDQTDRAPMKQFRSIKLDEAIPTNDNKTARD
jgi:hypothetical protein